MTTQEQPQTGEPVTRQEASFFGAGALRQTGNLFALAASVIRLTFKRPFQARELTEQFWFIASVTILPTALVSIPFGAVITLQVGSLTQQLGAESFTGAASVLAVVQQASPSRSRSPGKRSTSSARGRCGRPVTSSRSRRA